MSAGLENMRREERYNLFVMASLHAVGWAGPVKLRNISSEGALVEGEHLPSIGEPVELRRGALVMSGKIVWCTAKRAGLHFNQKTDVSQWLPGASAQKEVDSTFQRLKAEQQSPEDRTAGDAPLHGSFISIDNMVDAAAALDELGDTLAGDDEIIIKYASKLQVLDIAAQLLRKIASSRS